MRHPGMRCDGHVMPYSMLILSFKVHMNISYKSLARIVAESRKAGAMSEPYGKNALKLIERFLDAKCLLVVHGLISDSENARIKQRVDRWAQNHGLRRKP